MLSPPLLRVEMVAFMLITSGTQVDQICVLLAPVNNHMIGEECHLFMQQLILM